jgi:flavin reductase (DIM6/NTAB) family NADH-FMN oxidoreductase RutF
MTHLVTEDIGAYYQHYPRVAAVVTAHHEGRDNAMAVAWHTPISFKPPLYGVAIATKRFTYRLIVESREFGVNFLSFDQVELIAKVGANSGRDVDKFQQFKIAKRKPLKTGVPVLTAAYTAYECRLVDDREYGDHRLLVGEVVAVHMRRELFDDAQVLDLAQVNPALYLGDERYLPVSGGNTRYLDRKDFGVTDSAGKKA